MKRMMIALLCLLLIWNGYITYEFFQLKNKGSVNDNQSTVTVLNGVITDITELVSQSEPKVVSISSKKSDEVIATGSGAVYKSSEDGVYIITNTHVINNSDQIDVRFANGEIIKASIVGQDYVSDISVILVKPEFKVDSFTIGDSNNVNKGEYVLAIGSPLGLDFQGSVSFGVVSGVDRSIGMDQNNDGNIDWEVSVLQTDAAINPGNSGGPLINLKGELIGITSMKISSNNYEGIGFAIGSNEVIPIVDKLIEFKEIIRPYIGIKVKDITHMTVYQKSYYGISLDVTEGIYIKEVMNDSSAFISGLRVGDIITEINEISINNEKDFSKVIYGLNVGDTVSIKYFRNNEVFIANVVLQ